MAAPSKYKDHFPQLLIEHLAKGLSLDSFAGKVGVSYETLNEWVKNKPELAEAKKEGLAKNLLQWEEWGLEGLWDITEFYDKDGNVIKTIKKINTTMWIFNLKNRHGWRDNVSIETDAELNFVLPEFLKDDEEKPKTD